ncbi:MAG TPA: hemolysin family protein [Kamptonema sp.]|nr:hemolysin family protein [Kamptonema sp.]
MLEMPSSFALSWTDALSRLLAVLLLIAINAFFVTAEFSIVSVRRSRINQLAAVGDLEAQTVQHLQRTIERVLSTTQLGITLSSLALGWIGEGTMAVLVRTLLAYLPLPPNISEAIAHSLSISILTFFLLAYLQIVLGELVPKSIALLYSEQLAKILGAPSLAIARFFNPFIWILNQSTRWLLRLFGMEYGVSHRPVTPQELQLIIATSSESTGLEAEERELLNNVFEFGAVTVEEVMTTRTSIVAIPRTATFQMLLDEISISGHSRYPTFRESLDDILGLVDFKQLAKPLAEGLLSPQTPIEPWIRPIRFVPEAMTLSELLSLMQRSPEEMAIVVNEYGGTSGLVTIKDLIAEIIGDSHEVADAEDLALQMLDDRTFLVQAQLELESVNEILNFNLPIADEYQTLGGFLIHELQKIPAVGEVFLYHNLEFTIISASGARLDQIRIRLLETPNPDNVSNNVW